MNIYIHIYIYARQNNKHATIIRQLKNFYHYIQDDILEKLQRLPNCEAEQNPYEKHLSEDS